MKRYQAIYPWAIILAGAIVRLWNLTALPAWYDEAYTILVARLPLGQLLQATAGDVHPPLYYLIVSGLIHATPAPAQLLTLRLFSVACATAGLALVWHVSGLLPVNRPARLVGLLLLCFHPVAIYYSQEGRMYAWLGLLVVIQCWAVLKQKWWVLGIATLLAIYTHNYGLFYSAILGLVGLGYYMLQPIPEYRPGQDTWLKGAPGQLIMAMGLPVLLWLPWVYVLAQQMGQLAGVGYWLPDISTGAVLLIIHRVVMGYIMLPGWQLLSIPIMAAGLVLCFASTRRWVVLWVLVAGPVILALVVSVLWGKPVLLYRGLLPGLPMLAMLGGLAFTQATTQPGKVGRWLLLLPVVVGLGGQLASGYIRDSKTDVSWPATALAEVPSTSMLVHMEDTSYITISENYPATDNYLLNAGCPEQPGGMSNLSRLGLGYKIITPSQLPEHYYLVAVISTLSTSCHENLFNQLTAGQPAVYKFSNNFGVYGIWKK